MTKKIVAKIVDNQVVAPQLGRYQGWSSITSDDDDNIFVVFSGDRDAHVCPWGKTFLVKSNNGGNSWQKPAVVNDTPLDDRDAGIVITKQGTILISWFTSLAFEDNSYRRLWKNLPKEKLQKWQENSDLLSDEVRKQWLGNWVRSSQNNNKSWGDPQSIPVTAPHGPILLKNGDLLFVGKVKKHNVVKAYISKDDGKTWQELSTLPTKELDNGAFYDEPHVVEADDGRLVVHFRIDPKNPAEAFIQQTESYDGGKTWSKPFSTPLLGYPPHLLRLNDGNLLATFSRRSPQYGQWAALSIDNGKTWQAKQEMLIHEGLNSDLGYPATTQLLDGTLLTTYYQQKKIGEPPAVMVTRWQLQIS